jgi:hypothetical protein
MITQNAPRFSLFVKEEERMEDNDRAFLLRSRWDSGTERPDLKDGGMTLSRYASIHLRVPMSGDPDLDRAIRESRRLDFAGQALAGICYEYFSNDFNKGSAKADISQIAHCAYLVADAMLAKWEGARK